MTQHDGAAAILGKKSVHLYLKIKLFFFTTEVVYAYYFIYIVPSF